MPAKTIWLNPVVRVARAATGKMKTAVSSTSIQSNPDSLEER
jgi:hypothetical protein